ncbi:MAG: Metal-dependent phosphohydrolase [uncultured Solirubrobacteraceae bacterium]|uniref:Metal-dependent phosphohydrolase n=1 Tax=uncultured Solirubrobacteraceae bacterium TaxID=1162706 RepID=A0A6J4S9T5_9ACTN|nr:MAG: Metal-dependent phosphohydrolase [uncultured Solirubrobacteraceae bacterium]
MIGALSYALDITEGQPMGHAARSCLIGMRIAEAIGLPEAASRSLFYALLMKDVGCSSNAARLSALFDGDDLAIKHDFKLADSESLIEMARYTARHAASDRGALARARRFAAIAARTEANTRRLIEIRCERGAEIARMVGLDEAAAEAIGCLDEHWNGGGHPLGLRGDGIPLLGRILCLAQTVEVFYSARGHAVAYEVAAARSGTWFDPALVDALSSFRGEAGFWLRVAGPDPAREVAREDPGAPDLPGDDSGLDLIAEGFARVIDAKTPYTARHSEGVARIAVGIATELGFDACELSDLRRAALLHDIGKLGVSNRILDKPGRLDDEEWKAVRRHPEFTLRILERVPVFESLAELAANHHERMDGRGYHRGLLAGELPLAHRVLVVADVFEALTATRPYRAGMPVEKALDIVHGDIGTAFCPEAAAGLDAWLDRAGDGWALAA